MTTSELTAIRSGPEQINSENRYDSNTPLIATNQTDNVPTSKCGLITAIITLLAVLLSTVINRSCCNYSGISIFIQCLAILSSFCGSLAIIGIFIKRPNITGNNNHDRPYMRLRKSSMILLGLLFVGSLIFNINHIIGVSKCLHDTERVFEFSRSLLEILFIVLQFFFQLILTIKPEHFKGLTCIGNLILLIIVNNSIFIVQYFDDTLNNFRLNDFDEFPFMKVCANFTDLSTCYVNRNATSSSIHVDAYFYTFKVNYFLFSLLIMLPALGYSRSENPLSLDYNMSGPQQHISEINTENEIQQSGQATNRPFTNKLSKIKRLLRDCMKSRSASLYFSILTALLLLALNIGTYWNSFTKPLSKCNISEQFSIDFKLPLTAAATSQTVFQLVLGILVFYAVFYTLKRDNLKLIKSKDSDFILLSCAALVHLLLIFLEFIETITMESANTLNKVLHGFFICVHVLNISSQSLVILHFLNVGTKSHRFDLEVWLIIYIGVSNFAKWFLNIFFPPTIMVLLSDLNTTRFSIGYWWLIAKLIYPVVCFYRMASAYLCFQGYMIHHKQNQNNIQVHNYDQF